MRLRYLADPLARHFEAPDLGSKIGQILTTPVEQLEELLSIVWNIASLPTAWKEVMSTRNPEVETADSSRVSQRSRQPAILLLESSATTAHNIMETTSAAVREQQNFGNLRWAPVSDGSAMSRRNLNISSLVASSTLNGEMEISTEVESLPVAKNHNHDAEIMSSDASTSAHPSFDTALSASQSWVQDDARNSQRRLESGFAGEHFVYLLLKDRLPGFSESNWTSHLREHAGLTPCADGIADFEYENDMHAFLEMFQLERRRPWKKVYIEAKSTVGTDNQFHFSSTQFLRVQQFHGSDALYMVVRVKNSLSKPAILDFIDDPIRHLSDGGILFSTEGAVQVTVNTAV